MVNFFGKNVGGILIISVDVLNDESSIQRNGTMNASAIKIITKWDIICPASSFFSLFESPIFETADGDLTGFSNVAYC
jgi:hypothetical protein